MRCFALAGFCYTQLGKLVDDPNTRGNLPAHLEHFHSLATINRYTLLDYMNRLLVSEWMGPPGHSLGSSISGSLNRTEDLDGHIACSGSSNQICWKDVHKKQDMLVKTLNLTQVDSLIYFRQAGITESHKPFKFATWGRLLYVNQNPWRSHSRNRVHPLPPAVVQATH